MESRLELHTKSFMRPWKKASSAEGINNFYCGPVEYVSKNAYRLNERAYSLNKDSVKMDSVIPYFSKYEDLKDQRELRVLCRTRPIFNKIPAGWQ